MRAQNSKSISWWLGKAEEEIAKRARALQATDLKSHNGLPRIRSFQTPVLESIERVLEYLR